MQLQEAQKALKKRGRRPKRTKTQFRSHPLKTRASRKRPRQTKEQSSLVQTIRQ